MEEPSSEQLIETLTAVANGRVSADELLPQVYSQLRNLARFLIACQKPGQTLQATALVHEAYLRLVGRADPGWDGRRHFFGAAAQAMRQILVDQARRKKAKKHGGGLQRVDLDDPAEPIVEIDPRFARVDMEELHDALSQLERHDPRAARVVELRYFGGLSPEEAAECVGVSRTTADRDWRVARSYLRKLLTAA